MIFQFSDQQIIMTLAWKAKSALIQPSCFVCNKITSYSGTFKSTDANWETSVSFFLLFYPALHAVVMPIWVPTCVGVCSEYYLISKCKPLLFFFALEVFVLVEDSKGLLAYYQLFSMQSLEVSCFIDSLEDFLYSKKICK